MVIRTLCYVALLIYIIFSFVDHKYGVSTWQWWFVNIGYILVLLIDIAFTLNKKRPKSNRDDN